jgi:hypothetical protein
MQKKRRRISHTWAPLKAKPIDWSHFSPPIISHKIGAFFNVEHVTKNEREEYYLTKGESSGSVNSDIRVDVMALLNLDI